MLRGVWQGLNCLFIHATFCVIATGGIPRANKNVVKLAIFGLMHWLKHRITQELLKIDRYMLRGVWQALNCLTIHARYCVIIAGASPGKGVEWRWGRQNTRFLTNSWRYSMYWTAYLPRNAYWSISGRFPYQYLHQTCTQYSNEGPQHWNAANFQKSVSKSRILSPKTVVCEFSSPYQQHAASQLCHYDVTEIWAMDCVIRRYKQSDVLLLSIVA